MANHVLAWYTKTLRAFQHANQAFKTRRLKGTHALCSSGICDIASVCRDDPVTLTIGAHARPRHLNLSSN